MLGEQISTGGPVHIHVYCCVQSFPHALNEKD